MCCLFYSYMPCGALPWYQGSWGQHVSLVIWVVYGTSSDQMIATVQYSTVQYSTVQYSTQTTSTGRARVPWDFIKSWWHHHYEIKQNEVLRHLFYDYVNHYAIKISITWNNHIDYVLTCHNILFWMQRISNAELFKLKGCYQLKGCYGHTL